MSFKSSCVQLVNTITEIKSLPFKLRKGAMKSQAILWPGERLWDLVKLVDTASCGNFHTSTSQRKQQIWFWKIPLYRESLRIHAHKGFNDSFYAKVSNVRVIKLQFMY